MKERGIIFSGDDPKLIAEGRKTQTRRLIKPQPESNTTRMYPIQTLDFSVDTNEWVREWLNKGRPWTDNVKFRCPYGIAGDRLWMREAFHIRRWGRKNSDRVLLVGWYGTGADFEITLTEKESALYRAWKRKTGNFPSIFMFRSLSRALMDLLKVRAERVQDISEEDAKAEGVEPLLLPSGTVADLNEGDTTGGRRATFKAGYSALWDSLHGKGAWERNDWVWVLDFKRD
jgi:hypothetical protein